MLRADCSTKLFFVVSVLFIAVHLVAWTGSHSSSRWPVTYYAVLADLKLASILLRQPPK